MASEATVDSSVARCLIGCGANLGCRREQLDQAIDILRFMPGINLLEVSRFIETRPIGGPPGQPAYLNAACLIETSFGPEDLLAMLTAVENTLDRQRDQRWGPRSIDLDLLLHGDRVIENDRLQLPHPRMTTRRFVLEPAAEIAPEFEHPLAGCTIGALLENISQRHLHIAVVGVPGSGCPEIADAVADVTLSRLLHAPTPLPSTSDSEAGTAAIWQQTLTRYAAPLRRSTWPNDPHGTVTDYWLETLRLAAARMLDQPDRDGLLATFDQLASEAVPPHVVLFLEVSRNALEERIRFRSRPPHRSDIFADLAGPRGSARVGSEVEALLELQTDLRDCLCDRNCGPRPKAVVRLDADDLGRAALEAVAAIEAIS